MFNATTWSQTVIFVPICKGKASAPQVLIHCHKWSQTSFLLPICKGVCTRKWCPLIKWLLLPIYKGAGPELHFTCQYRLENGCLIPFETKGQKWHRPNRISFNFYQSIDAQWTSKISVKESSTKSRPKKFKIKSDTVLIG